MARGEKWTDEEWQKADSMKKAGASVEEIACALSRTNKAVVGRFHYMNLSPEALEKTRRRVRGYRSEHYEPAHLSARRKIPDRVLDERDRAINADRTLTAVMFGDPLPGRSALDRRTGA